MIWNKKPTLQRMSLCPSSWTDAMKVKTFQYTIFTQTSNENVFLNHHLKNSEGREVDSIIIYKVKCDLYMYFPEN
jgi:hypothetical protein